MNLVICVVLIIACLATPTLTQFNRRQVRQDCITPENNHGRCVALSYCPQVINVFQVKDRRTAQNYVISLQRACGTRSFNGDPLVCCTRPISNPPVTEPPPRPIFPTDSSFMLPQIQSTTAANPWLFVSTEKPETTTPRALASIPTPPTTTAINPWLFVTTERSTTTTRRTTLPPPPPVEQRGSSCRWPPGTLGECVDIKSCEPVFNQLRVRQNDPKFKKELQISNLICGSIGSNVCCPTGQAITTTTQRIPENNADIPRRLPTVEEGCGATPNALGFNKVIGGEPAKIGAWPWAALLGYDDGSTTSFKCGGVLITARHVVTAAHCIKEHLTFVRLGEHDLSTDTETQHVDIPIAKNVTYPHYRNRRGDIAMIYLERNVEFTNTIIPICMPSSPSLRAKSYVNTNPFVVGWGKTMKIGASSNILMQLMIPVHSNEVCREQYRGNRNFNEEQFDKAVLCAGVLGGGKDTCQGDSGGPLMTSEVINDQARFYLIGLVSYGVGCASPNFFGVYTSTQYFMDWIIEMLQNTP